MKKTFTLLSLLFAAAILLAACSGKPAAEQAVKGVSYEDTVGFSQFQQWKAQNERVNPVNNYQSASSPQVVYVNTPPKVVTRKVYTTAPKAVEKKGWSKAAKGTAIGAGSGAVLGAVVNKKNRVLGGVIGGVLGGGIGYGIGRSMDKKDGRVE